MFRVHPIQLRRATEAPHIHFLTTTPDDPRAYIIASNIARRHMSKGQQAMAVAMVYPEPEKTTHGKKSKTKLLLETKTNFSGARLSQARTVLACSTDLALAVLAGTKALDAAYGEAKKALAETGVRSSLRGIFRQIE